MNWHGAALLIRQQPPQAAASIQGTRHPRQPPYAAASTPGSRRPRQPPPPCPPPLRPCPPPAAAHHEQRPARLVHLDGAAAAQVVLTEPVLPAHALLVLRRGGVGAAGQGGSLGWRWRRAPCGGEGETAGPGRPGDGPGPPSAASVPPAHRRSRVPHASPHTSPRSPRSRAPPPSGTAPARACAPRRGCARWRCRARRPWCARWPRRMPPCRPPRRWPAGGRGRCGIGAARRGGGRARLRGGARARSAQGAAGCRLPCGWHGMPLRSRPCCRSSRRRRLPSPPSPASACRACRRRARPAPAV
jgi:hypothetical protein